MAVPLFVRELPKNILLNELSLILFRHATPSR